MEEHEVLGDYWGSWATEVERERIFDRTEIMKFENEILWEEALRTPNDPTDADLREAILICNTTLSLEWICLRGDLRPEVLMDTTLGILKSHSNLGVANGATKPPEAAST